MEIEKIALLDTVLNPRKIENIAKYRGNSCFKICMLIGFCCLWDDYLKYKVETDA